LSDGPQGKPGPGLFKAVGRVMVREGPKLFRSSGWRSTGFCPRPAETNGLPKDFTRRTSMLTDVPQQSLLISPIPAGEGAFSYPVSQSQPRRAPLCRPMTSPFRG
jgi:hypothetical protein